MLDRKFEAGMMVLCQSVSQVDRWADRCSNTWYKGKNLRDVCWTGELRQG